MCHIDVAAPYPINCCTCQFGTSAYEKYAITAYVMISEQSWGVQLWVLQRFELTIVGSNLKSDKISRKRNRTPR